MSVYYASPDLYRQDGTCLHNNSVLDYLQREAGMLIHEDIHITGTGSLTANVFQWTRCILIHSQWAILNEVTTLTNATDVYADIWDGTTATKLTAGNPGGAVLSNSPVGSFFSKTGDETQTYTVLKSDQARVDEPSDKKIGRPFTLIAKNGSSNYIRFHLTTTDDPIDFVMHIHFEWCPLDQDATLTFLL